MNSFNKFCVVTILTLIGVFSANGFRTLKAEPSDIRVIQAAQRSLNGPMASTFRIRSQVSHGNTLITGHGTAWGIDLEEFGYHKHRYVMTACHVIREHDGSICPNLQLEMRHSGGVHWAGLRVLASDPKMDVAVLECETELPVITSFCEHDAPERTNVVMIGSPGGVPLKAVKGYVTTIKRSEPSVAYVEYIQEGCSGGPIFDAASQNVMGLVIAGIGIGNNPKMDPHTCLYVSVTNMKHFLRTALKRGGDGGSERRNSPRAGKHRIDHEGPNSLQSADRDDELEVLRHNLYGGSNHIQSEAEYAAPRAPCKCKKGDPDCVDHNGVWLP